MIGAIASVRAQNVALDAGIKLFLENAPINSSFGHGRLWTIGALGLGAVYAASNFFGETKDPKGLVEDQDKLLEAAKEAEKALKAAQEALGRGQKTQEDLTSLMQAQVGQQEALLGQRADKPDLDPFKGFLGELLHQLKQLPEHQQRVETLGNQQARLETLKAQCARLKSRLAALKPELEKEEMLVKELLEQLEKKLGI